MAANGFCVDRVKWLLKDCFSLHTCSLFHCLSCGRGWTSQVTYVTMVPRVGNETLRPLGVATGNASSVTRVWRYICKHTIRWPATAHDVTTGATIIKGSPGAYIISFFVWSLRPKHGPKPRGRSVSFPTRGTMVTYVTWDVPLHGNSNCVP